MSMQTEPKPNGPAAAALLAAGVGSTVLGLMVVGAEMSADFGTFLDFAKNYGIGSGVGPLSGKVVIATIAFAVTWIVLHFLWRRRDVNFNLAFIAALILVGIGFALTFPPIFVIFAQE